MAASSLKGLNHGEVSFVSRCTKECKRPRRAAHGGRRKDGTIIEVGLAWVSWRQDLSNRWGQSVRQKIEYMRCDKEFKG